MVAVNLWGQLPTNDQILRGSVSRPRASSEPQGDATRVSEAASMSGWTTWGCVAIAAVCVGAALFQIDSNSVTKVVAAVMPKEATVQPVGSVNAELRALENRAVATVAAEAATKPSAQMNAAPDAVATQVPASAGNIRSTTQPIRSYVTRTPLAAAVPAAKAAPATREPLPPPSGIPVDPSQTSKGVSSDLRIKRIGPLSVDSKEAAAISPLIPN